MPCQAIFFEHQLDAKKNSPDLSGPTSIEHQLEKVYPVKRDYLPPRSFLRKLITGAGRSVRLVRPP